MTITHAGETLTIEVSLYASGATAFLVKDETGAPYATLSVNLPESKHLPVGTAFVKHYSENAPLFSSLMAQHALIATGITAPAGYAGIVHAYSIAE